MKVYDPNTYPWDTDPNDPSHWIYIHDLGPWDPVTKKPIPLTDYQDRALMCAHILLELLDYLKVVEYSKFYDSHYAIRIKKR